MKLPQHSLSFCITCMNRLHQIKQTLRKNLDDNRKHMDIIEFVLVDLGSTDGLRQWIEENFIDDMDSGYLRYYYTEELTFWHASIAKNTSHILAKNEIVVNLDCDNFTGEEGGQFVLDNMMKYELYNPVIHQFSNKFGDGSFGRIALSKKNFLIIGGYDESLGPHGYEDINLLQRLWVKGHAYIHLADEKYNTAIANTKEEGVVNINTNVAWLEMNRQSRLVSVRNITSGRIVANKTQGYIGITKNIYRITVTNK